MTLLDVREKQKRGNGKPHERIRLTDSLIVALWRREDRDGNSRLSWSIDRHNEKDPDVPFRMCDEKDALELPKFAELLCMAFAKRESLPGGLRKKLAAAAHALATTAELMRERTVNGEGKLEDKEEKELLSF